MAPKALPGILSLLGAVLGGVVGHYAYRWIATQGLMAPVVPGAFVGLGCAAFSRRKSIVRGLLCGVAGLGLGLFSRWTIDGHDGLTFKDFVIHFSEYLSTITEVMLGVGALLAFWIGQESWRGAPAGVKPPPAPLPPQQTQP